MQMVLSLNYDRSHQQLISFLHLALHDLGVKLCGGDVGVREHLADDFDAHSARERPSGEGVPRHVHGEPLFDAGGLGNHLEKIITLLVRD